MCYVNLVTTMQINECGPAEGNKDKYAVRAVI